VSNEISAKRLPPPVQPSPLYIFLDEGGNLDFSPSGSLYFTMTSVAVRRPFPWEYKLAELRFDLIEYGLDIEYFHATEDRQPVRDRVFAAIQPAIRQIRADSIIVEKPKTGPSLQAPAAFYPRVLGYLLSYVVNGYDLSTASKIIVITDELPVQQKRETVKKAIKKVLSDKLPAGTSYRIFHHSSKSCSGLQVADYINWAIYRKWDRGDGRSLSLVAPCVRSQFDIFRHGEIRWY
jgi:hypothetical protein